jgi:hypothetical protein
MRVPYLLVSSLLLVTIVSAQNLPTVSNCFQSIHTQNEEKPLVELVENMKAEVERNSEVIQTILDNPSEFESLKNKVARCAEELLKKSQFKVLEQFIDHVLQPLTIGYFAFFA